MPAKLLWNLFVCGLLLSAVIVCVAAADDTVPVRPELTGHWVLNGKASEFPMFGGRGGGGEHSGGGRGGPGGPGGGNRMQLPTDMVIELADSELVVSERGLTVRKLELNGKAPSPPAPAPSASTTETSATPRANQPAILPAHWDGKRIISEYENRRGGLMRDTWELSKDGKQLVIKTALPPMDDRPGIEFKRVYDRVETDSRHLARD